MKIKRINFCRIESRFRDELPDIQDMLRYDVAFQWKLQPEIVAFPVFQTTNGNLGGLVTVARWDSFGVRIGPNPNESEDAPTAYNIRSDDWVTYRHPRVNGALDYTLLQPLSLTVFKNAKSWRELQ